MSRIRITPPGRPDPHSLKTLLISTMTPKCKCYSPQFSKRKLGLREDDYSGSRPIRLKDGWICSSPRRTSTEPWFLMDKEAASQSERILPNDTQPEHRKAVRNCLP